MSPMSLFVQLVVDGLIQGALYGSLALAIVLVNQSTGLVNFAQGGMALFGSYLGMTVGNLFIPGTGLIAGVTIGIVAAVVASMLMAALLERFLMRRFELAEEDTKVVATIGVLTLLGGLVGLIWGFSPTQYPFYFSITRTLRLGSISLSLWSVVTFVAIVSVMVVLQLLIRGTKLGLGLRAVADNAPSAALSGIRIGRMRMIGWGLAAALGTIAGILIAAKSGLVTSNFDSILVYALAAVVIGGLDSPIGVVFAALAMAVLESLAGAYTFLSTDLKGIVPFLLIFIVLAVRPQGLFGRKVVVRV
jgi:branched-chain amino acid transport system permease protein